MQTPFYQYDLALLNETLNAAAAQAARYGYTIHYALKANANPALLKIISGAGFGADCVSGNEIKVALKNGFKPQGIVFAGVGKTDWEIEYAIEQNIQCIHCESVQEFQVIEQIAQKLNKTASIALRINPNVDANTHKSITTGLKENKFGMSAEEASLILNSANKYKNINLVGLHFHIGSQIMNMEVFKNLALEVNRIQERLQSKALPYLNLGGGLGIDYINPRINRIADFAGYFKTINQWLNPGKEQTIHFELGRSLVGQCGQLYTRVLYTKTTKSRNFAIVDAGMNALIRPALYGAIHRIENISKIEYPTIATYDVVGPICETTDCFGEQVNLPNTERGDLLVIHSCGAYAESMASDYNLRERPKSVFNHSGLALLPKH
ncbi:MAG: diaminopimelate decarboxylase [Tenuifilum sp.]|uniref:diaminopimelate decarboxylase n=1 Tax=Tenuifilum sp. TaxID=2760880 RepID=UPI001B4C847C|nr:diaminopimelate decarboxylase [Bacteroidales bacterium]HOK61572.1 diaminopimelate decarboxylase [Tenuifilum sp.]MBP9028842.1 diaminopimelate decarboxylase [Bacteroidales bacterium]HOK86414.1 diaminopimelate decarboxylase [Tenuifilum sp.]HON71103.1 diaminopimelate decarboxylase [Tenuifilum sp.]